LQSRANLNVMPSGGFPSSQVVSFIPHLLQCPPHQRSPFIPCPPVIVIGHFLHIRFFANMERSTKNKNKSQVWLRINLLSWKKKRDEIQLQGEKSHPTFYGQVWVLVSLCWCCAWRGGIPRPDLYADLSEPVLLPCQMHLQSLKSTKEVNLQGVIKTHLDSLPLTPRAVNTWVGQHLGMCLGKG
jgi:hypothetical protein